MMSLQEWLGERGVDHHAGWGSSDRFNLFICTYFICYIELLYDYAFYLFFVNLIILHFIFKTIYGKK